ncbi:hypothetical protein M413DRAFT_444849 [Hebeloma cylindrosporum]|uniref:Uncharacterized protein n=1 Tax=Hebeloma cylindrosporum TaxID=76867 RepID=A0A0C3C0K9_HEBCY|nr:hypothetical protein M413DRAFT_444849 [Hebeloma cylindrosporum h7]
MGGCNDHDRNDRNDRRDESPQWVDDEEERSGYTTTSTFLFRFLCFQQEHLWNVRSIWWRHNQGVVGAAECERKWECADQGKEFVGQRGGSAVKNGSSDY